MADENARAPHHLRSIVEMGAGLALGTAGYWALERHNAADWDNPRPLSRFSGSSWVMDNNSVGINWLGHPFLGGVSYSLARFNHHGVWVSFAYSSMSSFLWEFVIEFKEKVSVNDVIVTPGAGLPIGESLYKLGLYLDTGHHDSWIASALRAVLGGGAVLDRRLDGREPPRVVSHDALGFASAIWHDFRLDAGSSTVETPGLSGYARHRLGFSADLVTLPGYLKPGRFGRAFWDAELSSIALDVEASIHGSGLSATADTMLLGYHWQDLVARGASSSGSSITLGTSLGWDYLRSSANRYASVEAAVARPGPALDYHAPNRREQHAAFRLPGLALETRAMGGAGSVSGAVRVQPAFGSASAFAFYDWAAEHPDDSSKHILHRQGYFYGWGGAVSVRLRASLGPLRGRVDLAYGAYRSQDGMDRQPEELTIDVPVTADFLQSGARLGFALGPVEIAASLGVRRFRSTVDGYEHTARAIDRGVSLSGAF